MLTPELEFPNDDGAVNLITVSEGSNLWPPVEKTTKRVEVNKLCSEELF